MGFRSLRVINDDRVAAGGGFPTHSHRDMEILSYVLEGALAHKDSMGTGSVIHPGEIQLMRAGTGVAHSEFNQSKTEPVHFLQIWIVPAERGLPPAYGQQAFDQEAARRDFALLASHDGRDGSLRLHQDVDLRMALVGPGATRHDAAAARAACLGAGGAGIGVGERLPSRRGRRCRAERRSGDRAVRPGQDRRSRSPVVRPRVVPSASR